MIIFQVNFNYYCYFFKSEDPMINFCLCFNSNFRKNLMMVEIKCYCLSIYYYIDSVNAITITTNFKMIKNFIRVIIIIFTDFINK